MLLHPIACGHAHRAPLPAEQRALSFYILIRRLLCLGIHHPHTADQDVYKRQVKASTRQKHQLLNEFVSFDARTDGQHALRDVLPGPQEEEPEALILQKQRLDEVHQAMETTLSELELEVLLRHISGESYQQIAMALDRPEKSVDNALQRIKNKLASFR